MLQVWHIVKRKKSSTSTQPLLTQTTSSNQNQFAQDLCKALVASDIPLYKLRNENLKSFFFGKYVDLTIPSETSMRRIVGEIYNETLETIRMHIKNKYLWISIDETTDSSGRYIANVVCGILDTDPEEAKKHFLVHVAELEKPDHAAIVRCFDDAIKLLDPKFDKTVILLFLTDAAPYVVKAVTALKIFYPKMTHLTCLIHGLHRVCEKIRESSPKVDQLISSVKKILLRRQKEYIFSKPLSQSSNCLHSLLSLDGVLGWRQLFIMRKISKKINAYFCCSIKLNQNLYKLPLIFKTMMTSASTLFLSQVISSLYSNQ
ncbi:uncharacterized protein LOC120782507 [Bactrocera tryoni]|uniref:uncharacterized protein LOC120782507 n=1 Tax=Bactrocera tryoni TaxID=59916 RepID=UPI001A979C8E|nr:uncharacterized protein LOC120782507 [Bactrocera tryoni]